MLKKTAERHLSSLEVQIMTTLWERPDLSVRDFVEALPRGRSRGYTAVMSQLAAKGLLERGPLGRAHGYRPQVSENEFVGQL